MPDMDVLDFAVRERSAEAVASVRGRPEKFDPEEIIRYLLSRHETLVSDSVLC